MENNWLSFYKDRINSSYQEYFEERYKPFLDYIKSQNKNHIQELGCGIGSISKALRKQGFTCEGIDLSHNMVNLANKNIGEEIFKQGDLLKLNFNCLSNTLSVSHGVLEHFSDKDIIKITNKALGSIHYVPLDKYVTPSFGDERLLPYEYWLELVKPQDYFLFNDEKDLCFKV